MQYYKNVYKEDNQYLRAIFKLQRFTNNFLDQYSYLLNNINYLQPAKINIIFDLHKICIWQMVFRFFFIYYRLKSNKVKSNFRHLIMKFNSYEYATF